MFNKRNNKLFKCLREELQLSEELCQEYKRKLRDLEKQKSKESYEQLLQSTADGTNEYVVDFGDGSSEHITADAFEIQAGGILFYNALPWTSRLAEDVISEYSSYVYTLEDEEALQLLLRAREPVAFFLKSLNPVVKRIGKAAKKNEIKS